MRHTAMEHAENNEKSRINRIIFSFTSNTLAFLIRLPKKKKKKINATLISFVKATTSIPRKQTKKPKEDKLTAKN